MRKKKTSLFFVRHFNFAYGKIVCVYYLCKVIQKYSFRMLDLNKELPNKKLAKAKTESSAFKCLKDLDSLFLIRYPSKQAKKREREREKRLFHLLTNRRLP